VFAGTPDWRRPIFKKFFDVPKAVELKNSRALSSEGNTWILDIKKTYGAVPLLFRFLDFDENELPSMDVVQNSVIFLVLYDITDYESFKRLDGIYNVLNEVFRGTPDRYLKFLLACNIEAGEALHVMTDKDAHDWMHDHNFLEKNGSEKPLREWDYYKINSETGEGVDRIFDEIIEHIKSQDWHDYR